MANFTDMLKGLFTGKKNENVQKSYVDFLDANVPIFNQYGDNIYSSDVVQTAIDCIATEATKLVPKHIRTDPDGMKSEINSPLNRLLKFGPNELMDTGSFLEKVIWLLYLNYNAFIYPTFTVKRDANGGEYRTYTGLYPLQPKIVEYLQDITGAMFIRFTFRSGERFTFRYDDIIHLRKKFSINTSMGGGMNGQPDNEAIKTTINVNDVTIQGLEKGIKESLSIRGIVNINTMMDDKQQEAERKKFERHIRDSESGILALDLKGDYKPIQREPKLIDSATLDFIQQKIFNYYGVSMPIITADYTDAQYEAFFQKTIQPLIMSLGRNFSRVLFSSRELGAGNEIVFYQKNLSYLSTQSKIELIKIAGSQGLLSLDQQLEILGYPPLPDGEGEIRTMSLNFINSEHITEYQMNNSKNGNGGNQNAQKGNGQQAD